MQSGDILAPLNRELDRIIVIERYKKGDITQNEVSRILGLSIRQVRRLIKSYQMLGRAGLRNRRSGKVASNRISDEIKGKALVLIREHFYDYGPTLAAEKLGEYFQMTISKETARKWMIEANLWQSHSKKMARPHPPRARRALLGELIQIDGSYHEWFEDRGPKCCLLVFIDDATSRLMKLQFSPAETTLDYLDAFKGYVQTHGVPRAVYFDKHCVFRVNLPTATTQDGVTQFGRVLRNMGVKPIFAHSPQAKGRVERANETLQDRLVKELRFHNISDTESANIFLEGFIERFNKRFEKEAETCENAHRPLTKTEITWLEYIFSIHTERKVNKDLLVRHNKKLIKIIPPLNRSRMLMNQKVVVCENSKGMKVYFRNKVLDFTMTKRGLEVPVLSRKTLDQYLDNELLDDKYWNRQG